MTSIHTNTSAIAALQTLRTINQGLETTQAHVSSGYRVGSASDNAAYWSIATTMRSDNAALSAVQDAIGLGAAKVDTAYAGMESTIEVMKEIKNKLVAARESGVDRAKIQEEIEQLQGQLQSIAESASFSGENWLKADINGTTSGTTELESGTVTKQIVGSFTRSGDSNVSIKTINLDLDKDNVLFDTTGNKGGILDSEVRTNAVKANDSTGTEYFLATVSYDAEWELMANGVYSDGGSFYVKLDGFFVAATDQAGNIDYTATQGSTFTYADDLTVADLDITELDTYKTSLGLGSDATEEDVLDVLISFVDRQLQTAISAAADLGSISMRIGLQEDFVSKLTDSIDSGIGRLVDADLNEESTRLKALQTQQQLGIQALSIANTSSQNILSLFN